MVNIYYFKCLNIDIKTKYTANLIIGLQIGNTGAII